MTHTSEAPELMSTGSFSPGRSILVTAPGLLVAIVIGLAASGVAHYFPVVGAPVVAIVLGILLALVRPARETLRPGLHFAGKFVLQAAVVLLGVGLSLHQVESVGLSSLPVLVGTLAVGLVAAWIVGRWLGVVGDVRTLIGVGTAICGASAIAATDSVIDAPEQDVAYAIATIFTFNVVAVLTFPSLGRLLHLSQHSFGLLAGTAVNDVSSVVAASSAYGHVASSYAIIVKLTRTLMIIPISLFLAFMKARQESGRKLGTRAVLTPKMLVSLFPLFILWFLTAVMLNSYGFISSGARHDLSNVAQLCIATALGAIGLSTRLRDIRTAGFRPLALGAIVWVGVSVTSLLLQCAVGG